MYVHARANYGWAQALERKGVRSDYTYHKKEVQRLAGQVEGSEVPFHGLLSEYQNEEESVRRGCPSTLAIRNGLAEVFVHQIVPWMHIHIFEKSDCADDTE